MRTTLISASIALLFLSGCASIDAKKSLKANVNTESADNKYIAFRSAHPDSKHLPSMILRLSQTHLKAKEYLLSDYYAKSFLSEYSYDKHVPEAFYLHIKSIYMRFKENGSSEELANQIKNNSKEFVSNFPKSKYLSKVIQIEKDSRKVIANRNEEIAKTYDTLGNKKAAEYYRSKNKK